MHPNSKVVQRTQTAHRLAKKKQFTENLKTQKLSSGEAIEQAILPIDTIIGGTFRILSVIGMGGMGVVYLVEQTSLDKQFALKVLAPDLVNEQNWQRFKAEAKTMASLNHPSFVNVYDLGIHAGKIPFYAMDYLKGRSLEEVLAEDGALSIEQALYIFHEVANSLAYAHRNDIVHRDIKPANIMLCSNNDAKTVKVLDFGISKLVGAGGSKLQSLTLAGEIFGSPYYMSPEQCCGASVDARSDIYSIGCALFEALTGYVPFEGSTSLETMLMHRDDQAPLLAEVSTRRKFSLPLEAVVKTCLAKQPQNRYQSSKELAEDLDRIRKGKSIQTTSPAMERLIRLENQQQEKLEAKALENASPKSRRITQHQPKRITVVAISLASLALTLAISASFFMQSPKAKLNVKQGIHEHNQTDLALPNTASNLNTNKTIQPEQANYYSKITNEGRTIEFNFPQDQSLGKIGISQKPRSLVRAQSTVILPAHSNIHFYPSVAMFSHPELFGGFRENDLHSLTVPFELQESYDLKKATSAIAKLNGIKSLNLLGGKISDEQIPDLNKMTNLDTLDVSSTDITGAGVANLTRLKELQTLYCGFITDHTKLLIALQGSSKLKAISLNALGEPLSEYDARLIARCKNLRYLNLEASVDSDKVMPILATLPKLEYIDLHGCTISEKAINSFIKACSPRHIRITKPQVIPNSKSILEIESPENWLSK